MAGRRAGAATASANAISSAGGAGMASNSILPSTRDPRATEQDRFLQDLEDENPELAVQTASQTPVYPVLQLLRMDIKSLIDTSLSWEDLTGHELNFALVRPLALKYSKLRSPAILYALLFTRIHFLRESERDLAYRNVNETRAALCELLATKLLRTFATDGMELVTALAAPFWPWQGADETTLAAAKARGMGADDADSQATSTLEYAIQSSAKKFVATPLVQKVVDGIWNGNVVLGHAGSKHALVDDSWKKRPVTLYDPASSPLLDHRRLRVPRIRAFLEAMNFICILVLYAWCLGSKDTMTFAISEALFTTWLVGLAIDELASLQEHGFSVYLGGSFFNVLDALFCTVGFTWLGIRVYSLMTGNTVASKTAFDILSLGAIVLCPRLASLLVADNVLLLSLRAMIKEFFYFLALALVFFLGFTATFYLLAEGEEWSIGNISWLLLRFTYGTTISLPEAQAFTRVFGPVLVVSFTILAQTLLLTILISLLSSTFASVASHAQEVSLYQHACVALSASSSDAVFSYVPPTNVICLLIVYPASFFLTPRWLHKVNVWLIRATHLPVLLAIRLLQQYQWKKGIELATEKSGKLLDNWGWKTQRGQPDVIESVFADLYDQSAIPEELSNLFPTSKPISKTYSHPWLHSTDTQHSHSQLYHHSADDTFEMPKGETPLPRGRVAVPKTGRGGNVAWGVNRSSTWKDLASKSKDNTQGEAQPEADEPQPGQEPSATASSPTKKKNKKQPDGGHAKSSSLSKILSGSGSGSKERSGSTSPDVSPSTSPRRRYTLLGRHRKGVSEHKNREQPGGASIDSVLHEGQEEDINVGEEAAHTGACARANEGEEADNEPQSMVDEAEAEAQEGSGAGGGGDRGGSGIAGSPPPLGGHSGSLGELLERRGSASGSIAAGGGGADGAGESDRPGGTAEILMRLLERLDDQAQAVERLETLLKQTMKDQKKSAKKGDGGGDTGGGERQEGEGEDGEEGKGKGKEKEK